MKALLFLQALSAFRDVFIGIVSEVERLVPDNAPGTMKFDLFLKTVLAFDDELKKYEPVMPQIAAFAKGAYNIAQSLKK